MTVHPSVVTEVVRRFELDQAARRGVDAVNVEQVDADNSAWLMSVVSAHGWPLRSEVGEQVALAFWLLAQHMVDEEDRGVCLRLLEAACRKGEASWSQLAYLADRHLVMAGRKQLYGTQLQSSRRGLQVFPIHRPERVDERRERAGLGSLEEYVARARRSYPGS